MFNCISIVREYIWICGGSTSKSKEKHSCQDLSGLKPPMQKLYKRSRSRCSCNPAHPWAFACFSESHIYFEISAPTFCNLGNYILKIELNSFAIWTNINQENYILHFGQTHVLVIQPLVFCRCLPAEVGQKAIGHVKRSATKSFGHNLMTSRYIQIFYCTNIDDH